MLRGACFYTDFIKRSICLGTIIAAVPQLRIQANRKFQIACRTLLGLTPLIFIGREQAVAPYFRVESLALNLYTEAKRSRKEIRQMPNEVSLMITAEGLTALASMALAPKNQARLDDLLTKNVEGKLSDEEAKELDLLLTQVDELNLVKARAAATLHRIEN